MKIHLTVLLSGALTAFAAGAAGPNEAPPPPPPGIAAPGHPGSHPPRRPDAPWRQNPENFRRGPGIWRSFARLPQNEQQELLKLQRSDPDKFRSIMQRKADELFQKEKSKWDALKLLAERCRDCKDPAEKDALRSELRGKLKEDFMQRLKYSREDLDTFKRRVARMETELQKREKNADGIVDAMLDRLLNAPAARP